MHFNKHKPNQNMQIPCQNISYNHLINSQNQYVEHEAKLRILDQTIKMQGNVLRQ